MDQGEEQVDYGDEEHASANGALPTPFNGGAPPPDEADDDYDDLYQDVNVGFIEPHRLHVSLQSPLPQNPPPHLHISPPPPPPPLPTQLDVATSVPLRLPPAPPEEETPMFTGRRAGVESTSGHRGGGGGSSSAAGTPTSTPRGDPDYSAARGGGGGGAESGSGGMRSVFVGELHWWTTDAELEAALSEYGRVKEIVFFQERASGKSKGFCQVHFFEPAAARACKEGLNGRVFNGRACVVAYKSPRSLRTMSDPNPKDNKRVAANDGGGGSARGGGGGGYEGGRNYGRSGRGSHGQGQGRGLGQGRGRSSNKGGVNSGGGHYGQGLLGPLGMQPQPQPGGLMQPMGNQGFDPSFGRGGGGWPSFPGMVAPYPGSMGIPLAGVAPHVNPAFFNRGLAANGMGMMPSANTNSPGMEWSDWAAEGLPARRGADSSHGDDSGSGYGYGYADNKIYERGAGGRSNQNTPRGRDSEWMPEKRHRSEKDVDWERERDRERYRDRERNVYRDQRNINWDKDDEYERERDRERVVAARPRSKSRALEEDDPHSHPRPLPDYGKRRR